MPSAAEVVVVAGAVLGDIDFRIAVMVAQADQRVGQPAGVDRPAEGGKAHAGRHRAEPGAEQALRRFRDTRPARSN